MADRRLEILAVLRPIGLVYGAPVPPIEPALRAGAFLLTRAVRVPLGSRRALSGRSLAKALPKGLIQRGDVLVRLETGDVYAWIKRDRADLKCLGALPEILGQPPVACPGPTALRIVSADPAGPARVIARITGHAPDAIAQQIATGTPLRLSAMVVHALLVEAIAASGRSRCGDQTSSASPGLFAQFHPCDSAGGSDDGARALRPPRRGSSAPDQTRPDHRAEACSDTPDGTAPPPSDAGNPGR